MTLFQPGSQAVDVIVPLELDVSRWPSHVSRGVEPLREWEHWTSAKLISFRFEDVGDLQDQATQLVDRGVQQVGGDWLSVRFFDDENRGNHTARLGYDLLVIEVLDLCQIAPGPHEPVCPPLKMRAGAGSLACDLLVRQS